MSNPDFALAESVSTTNASYFIIVYIVILIYCCFGLAVVCDVYFVPALQKLSYTYDLPPDIAGSTLMALGASVPELFASLIGVFVTEDDIGTGSIIGSSCFNLIAVPAACAFVASASFTKKLTINPMPVIRNSAFYAITILVLLLIIKDNKVDIPEALILLLFFVMYMAFMIFCAQSKHSPDSISNQHQNQQQNNSLDNSYLSTDSAIHSDCNENHNHQQVASSEQHSSPSTDQQQQQQQQQKKFNQSLAAYGQFYFDTSDPASNLAYHHNISLSASNLVLGAAANERTPLVKVANKSVHIPVQQQPQLSSPPPHYYQSQQSIRYPKAPTVAELDSVSVNLGIAIKNSTCLVRRVNESGDDEAKCGGKVAANGSVDAEELEDNWVSSKWILVPMLPLTLGMKVLTPCKFKNTCWTIWTFLVSIALIGALTYVSVWVVHCFGQAVGIPETVAGMTILSWGTGIPELIASIVLIKKTAQADMAICNTIGSNVIDVSFCLALPWIVKCILNRTSGVQPAVAIQSGALPWTSFTLLLSVLALIVIFKLHDWILDYKVGIWLLLTYIAFVIGATYLEYTFSDTGLDLFEYI